MPHKKQGHITVDAAIERPVPVDAHTAAARNERVGHSIPNDHTADHQPYHEPSASGHPSLKHLKQLTHVHEVIKHKR